MIKTLVIPAIIIAAFLSIAATLMATAPVLEPSSETAMPLTVRVQTVAKEAVELKVHSQGSVVPSTISQLIPEVSGRVVWTSPNLVTGGFLTPGRNWRESMTWTIEVPEIGRMPPSNEQRQKWNMPSTNTVG